MAKAQAIDPAYRLGKNAELAKRAHAYAARQGIIPKNDPLPEWVQ